MDLPSTLDRSLIQMASVNPIDQFILDYWKSVDGPKADTNVTASPCIFDEADESSDAELKEINRQVRMCPFRSIRARRCRVV